jgi:protein TonB
LFIQHLTVAQETKYYCSEPAYPRICDSELPEVEQEETICIITDVPPEFPGGEDSLHKFISRELQYPEEAIKKQIQGLVFVKFVVEKDGSITNIQVVRGIYPLLDEEAVRVIKNMPPWIPAEKNGKKVRSQFTLPIVFKLYDD